MEDQLWLDYETRSVVDLDERGLDNYVHDSSTQVLLAAYAFGDRVPKLWEPHLNPQIPLELEDALLDPFVRVCSWNSQFEQAITQYILKINKPISEFRDPMCNARYLGLPGKLDEAGRILGLGSDLSKIADGTRLVRLFCMPESEGGEQTLFGISEPTFRDWRTDPKDWKLFGEYCVRDVIAERAAMRRMHPFPLSQEEWETWLLSEKINSTGWPVDLLLVKNAGDIAVRTREPLLVRMKDLTGLQNCNSRNQLLPWLQERGYLFDSLGKELIVRALGGDCELTPECKEVLELRQQTAKSSISKYTALADMTAEDARLRYQYTYYGAHTGRWCLAEDTSVTVKTEEGVVTSKAIQNVLLTDLVWDGEEWVKHDGVVFSGDKETILYEGVEATPEHEVWVSPSKKIPLGEAKTKEIPLWKGKPAYEIYRLTSPSGKSYIGLTNMGTSERWKKHILRAFNENRNHPLYNAIRKYGADSFLVETIDYALSKKHAQQLEIEHIAKHPQHILYNISPGGEADGETGSAIFWKRMEENPEEKEAYIQKLSDTQKSRGPEAHAHLSPAAQVWREEHPKEAYKISRRNVRKTPSHKNPKKVDTRPLIEKLRWKHNRPEASRIMKQDWWNNAGEERRKEIAENVSKGKKKEWEDKSPEEQQEMIERLDQMQKSVNRSVQGEAASKGLKRFWEELRKDPVQYREYLDSRSQTLKETLKVKYANV